MNAAYLRHVKNQTDTICITSVKINGLNLKFVNQQTRKICVKACLQDLRAFIYVKEKYKRQVQGDVEGVLRGESVFIPN